MPPRFTVSRRTLLAGSLAMLACRVRPGWAAPADPFALGVASGNPTADGVVLWTRLAPEPLSPDPALGGAALGLASLYASAGFSSAPAMAGFASMSAGLG